MPATDHRTGKSGKPSERMGSIHEIPDRTIMTSHRHNGRQIDKAIPTMWRTELYLFLSTTRDTDRPEDRRLRRNQTYSNNASLSAIQLLDKSVISVVSGVPRMVTVRLTTLGRCKHESSTARGNSYSQWKLRTFLHLALHSR